MKDKICCFAGYVQDFNNADDEKIKLAIKKQSKNLIKNHDVKEFYVGAESYFDSLCIECMEEIKKEYPSIKLCLVSTEPSHDIEPDVLNLFNEVVNLNFRKVSPEYTLFQKNDWLIEKSDFLIAYINNSFSCPLNIVKYKNSKGQLVVSNLSEYNLERVHIKMASKIKAKVTIEK